MHAAPSISSVAVVAAAALCGCGSDRRPAETAASTARVSSSIADGAELSRPVLWQARVSGVTAGRVRAVRFLIDGEVRHVARALPYVFAGRGNRLLAGTLGAGSHTFAVDVDLADGTRVTTASTAIVAAGAHGVPRPVIGRWTRTIRGTAGGLAHGTWRLQISTGGVARYVAPAAQDATAVQVRFAPGGRLAVGNAIPSVPHASTGGFCPDTAGAGEYRWSLDRGALVVHAVDDECAARIRFWNGRFTR